MRTLIISWSKPDGFLFATFFLTVNELSEEKNRNNRHNDQIDTQTLIIALSLSLIVKTYICCIIINSNFSFT